MRLGVVLSLLLALARTVGAQGKPAETKPDPKDAACVYVPQASRPLIRGARENSILLRSMSPNCEMHLKKITPFGGGSGDIPAVLRDAGGNALPAMFNPTDLRLAIDYVPTSIADKTSFDLYRTDTGVKLGSIELTGKTITVEPKINVTYDKQSVDALQDGISDKGVAVVGNHVVNTVSVGVPDVMPASSNEMDYWEIHDPSWSKDVEFQHGEMFGDTPHFALHRVSEVSFRVAQRQASPLHVQLSYRQHYDPKSSKPLPTDPIWFTVDVVLATEARRESLPIALAQYGHITCRKESWDIVQSGIAAVEDDALQTGTCRIALRIQDATGKLDLLKETLAEYGPQTIQVTVSRTKATARSQIWQVDLDSRRIELPLFPPDDDDKGEGPYTISAVILPSAKQASYRSGVMTSVIDGTKVLPDYTFSAMLRPRGQFSTGKGFRLFATFPVDLLAMRFPARVRDLDRSSGGSSVQISSLHAGFDLVIEPWDYARARNDSPILPVQGVVGLGLAELTSKRLAPSFIVGANVVLATIGSDKLPTSVTIGFYYERDLVESHNGSHFLLTTSVNFLSLFGAQSSGK